MALPECQACLHPLVWHRKAASTFTLKVLGRAKYRRIIYMRHILSICLVMVGLLSAMLHEGFWRFSLNRPLCRFSL